jgi:hypothetical protein
MTLSVVWVVLAATVIMLAMLRRIGVSPEPSEVRVRQSGKALTVVAIVYSLVLIAGFFYIGWEHGLALIK